MPSIVLCQTMKIYENCSQQTCVKVGLMDYVRELRTMSPTEACPIFSRADIYIHAYIRIVKQWALESDTFF